MWYQNQPSSRQACTHLKSYCEWQSIYLHHQPHELRTIHVLAELIFIGRRTFRFVSPFHPDQKKRLHVDARTKRRTKVRLNNYWLKYCITSLLWTHLGWYIVVRIHKHLVYCWFIVVIDLLLPSASLSTHPGLSWVLSEDRMKSWNPAQIPLSGCFY